MEQENRALKAFVIILGVLLTLAVVMFSIALIIQTKEIESLKQTIANDNNWLEIMQYEVDYWYDIAHGVVR